MNPTDECLELWPLARPSQRELNANSPAEKESHRIALANSAVADMVGRWRDGQQLSDEDYLTMRGLINDAATDRAAGAYMRVMGVFLGRGIWQHYSDAIAYYGINDPAEQARCERQGGRALFGAIVIANEFMVQNDTSVRVPSHFERIALESIKYILWRLTGQQLLELPKDDDYKFKAAVEREWRKVLRYGNGFYGFTVIPKVSIMDMVRYQQLHGGDDLVSWSISNWVLWTYTAFPVVIEAVAPGFNEKAFKARLEAMYEPLVQACAIEMLRRARATRTQWTDVPAKEDVIGEFRALLSSAVDDYDFTYGKPKAQASTVGAIGLASSPEIRDQLDRQLAKAGAPISSREMAHVGFARYISAKFENHLRQSYAFYGGDVEYSETETDAGDLTDSDEEGAEVLGYGEDAVYPRTEAGGNDLTDSHGEAAEVFAEESARTGRMSDVGLEVKVAFEKDGVEYLYRRQMALACRVTEEQLRYWHRQDYLPTPRVRDIDPGAPRTIANRRVYPWTDDMREQIRELAERQEALKANPTEGLLSLEIAAKRLNKEPRTLHNWRSEGKIEEVRHGNRVFIPEEEVERLA